MAIEFDPTEQWHRVASELRAYKETQQQAWGDIDNATLGRYLAGELSGEERARVEQALTQYPELLKLTDVVRDVLEEALGDGLRHAVQQRPVGGAAHHAEGRFVREAE